MAAAAAGQAFLRGRRQIAMSMYLGERNVVRFAHFKVGIGHSCGDPPQEENEADPKTARLHRTLCGKNMLDTHQSSGRLGKRGRGVGGNCERENRDSSPRQSTSLCRPDGVAVEKLRNNEAAIKSREYMVWFSSNQLVTVQFPRFVGRIKRAQIRLSPPQSVLPAKQGLEFCQKWPSVEYNR